MLESAKKKSLLGEKNNNKLIGFKTASKIYLSFIVQRLKSVLFNFLCPAMYCTSFCMRKQVDQLININYF